MRCYKLIDIFILSKKKLKKKKKMALEVDPSLLVRSISKTGFRSRQVPSQEPEPHLKTISVPGPGLFSTTL